jgi:hypothetical protein
MTTQDGYTRISFGLLCAFSAQQLSWHNNFFCIVSHRQPKQKGPKSGVED